MYRKFNKISKIKKVLIQQNTKLLKNQKILKKNGRLTPSKINLTKQRIQVRMENISALKRAMRDFKEDEKRKKPYIKSIEISLAKPR